MIMISVIVPLYNGKKHVDKLIKSLSGISVDKEIIIVDDGSTDGGGQYCKSKFSDNKRVFVITQKNGGVHNARNLGLKYAHGHYVMFVDQDDLIEPNTVNKVIKEAYKNHLQVAFWKTVHLYEDDSIENCDNVFKNAVLNRDEIIQDLIPATLFLSKSKYVSYLGHVWAGIYERELVENNNIRFKRFHSYEDDFLFVFDCLMVSQLVGFDNKIGYYWYENRGSISRNPKYIADYISKAEKLHLYLFEEAKKHGEGKIGVNKFIRQARQRIIVRAIKNAAGSFPSSRNAFKDILKRKHNKLYCDAFDSERSAMPSKIDRILLTLVCRRHFRIAYLTYYLYSHVYISLLKRR